MTTPAAFLRAVLDAPDDDRPRLVFADWLEERGDPRGEFIRVQVELARVCDLPINQSISASEEAALRRRERALFADHGDGWLRPFADPIGGDDVFLSVIPIDPADVPSWRACVLVRRGFAHAVTLTAAEWLAHADALLAAAPVREVTLTTWPEVWATYRPAGSIAFHFGGPPRGDFRAARVAHPHLPAALNFRWGPQPKMPPGQPLGPGVVTWHLPPSGLPLVELTGEIEAGHDRLDLTNAASPFRIEMAAPFITADCPGYPWLRMGLVVQARAAAAPNGFRAEFPRCVVRECPPVGRPGRVRLRVEAAPDRAMLGGEPGDNRTAAMLRDPD